MARRSGSIARVPAGGRAVPPPQDILGALAGGSVEPQLVFEVKDAGELALAWMNEAARQSGLLRMADPPMSEGSTPEEVLSPECAVSLREGYPESLRLGERYATEQFVEIDAAETWWLTTLAPLLDREGRPRWLVVTYLRLDFVRGTEAALERTEANIRKLIEATPDAVVVCRQDLRPVYANPAASALFGMTGTTSVAAPLAGGRTVLDLVPETSRAGLRASIAEAMTSDSATPVPFELRLAAPRALVLELRVIRLVFDGEPGVLISARDVTEIRLAQSSFAVADRLVALGRMAAGVAHEVNNPLAYVHANIHFAIEEVERARGLAPEDSAVVLKEVVVALREALDGAVRVRGIIQDMRHLSELDLGPQRPVSLGAAVESALKLARSELRSRGKLTIRLGTAPAVVAHEPRLVQVVLNLLLNAGHALAGAPRESGEIRVNVETDSAGRAVLEIADNGAGIDEADLPRLFDPFFTTRSPGEGLGLGLSVCHQIVTSLGGRIEVESSRGRGSTFRVVLPAAGAEAPERTGEEGTG